MNISVSEAKAQLTDLVRRAEQGEEVVLTRHGQPVAQIGPIRKARLSPQERARIIDEVMRAALGKASPGPEAAHSQDFLYDENGLPQLIAVDTSALLAIVLNEPAATQCARAMTDADRILVSAGSMAEALIVAQYRSVGEQMRDLLARLDIEVVPVTEAVAERVAVASRRWGKGIHPAGLNYGDCFAYALAEEHQCPLLFIGTDFSKTDISSAL